MELGFVLSLIFRDAPTKPTFSLFKISKRSGLTKAIKQSFVMWSHGLVKKI